MFALGVGDVRGSRNNPYRTLSTGSDDDGDRNSSTGGGPPHSRTHLQSARNMFTRKHYDQLKGPLLGVEVSGNLSVL